MATDPRPQLKKMVEIARRWAMLRMRYRKQLDSKSIDEKELMGIVLRMSSPEVRLDM